MKLTIVDYMQLKNLRLVHITSIYTFIYSNKGLKITWWAIAKLLAMIHPVL